MRCLLTAATRAFINSRFLAFQMAFKNNTRLAGVSPTYKRMVWKWQNVLLFILLLADFIVFFLLIGHIEMWLF